jgi:hypothetical protein
MSALLVAASLATATSVIATGCITYILISFRRSGHLMASRVGRRSPGLVLVTPENSRRQPMPKTRPAVLGVRRQLRPAFAH